MPAFMFWMLIASGLGLTKMVLIAKILQPGDFGNYAMLMSGSMLLTMVLSFGLIEGTIKRFPRLWVDSAISQIKADIRDIAVAVTRRSVILGGITLLALMILGRIDLGLPILFGILLGFTGLLVRLVSSVQLAIGDIKLLAKFSVFRSAAAFAIAALGAWQFGWVGAVSGELIALGLTVAQGAMAVSPRLGGGGGTVPVMEPTISDHRLYIGSVLTSGTMMADRGLINIVSGPAAAGSYGFIMILTQMGQIVLNIMAQKIGPEIIRDAKVKGSTSGAFHVIIRTAAVTILIAIAGTVTALMLQDLPAVAPLVEKYSVSSTSIILAGTICVFYLYVLLEYVLIAANREGSVVNASCAAALMFAIGFTVASAYGGLVEYYMAAALATRVVQTIWLAVALRKS